jgi:hypothetical protein
MSHQLTSTEIRFNNIKVSLVATVALFNILNDSFGPPYIQAISNTTTSLITAGQVMILEYESIDTGSMEHLECEAK